MNHLDRQGFLGSRSPYELSRLTVAIVGLGGGGSHIAQQAGHVGIGHYRLFDPDIIELSNLNRLVGATLADVTAKRAKVDIARRVIAGVSPSADVATFKGKWQDFSDVLAECDVVVSCLDSVQAKADLEALCRRMLTPMIDIGMDVHPVDGAFLISGQVALSTPPGPCLRCMGIIYDGNLTAEAQRYGAAGGQPQVVWPNGLLASTAVGILVGLVSPWHERSEPSTYLVYDGNRHTLSACSRLERIRGRLCPHHPRAETGKLFFDIRDLVQVERRDSFRHA